MPEAFYILQILFANLTLQSNEFHNKGKSVNKSHSLAIVKDRFSVIFY